jgi:hypothetical protein
MFPRLIACTPGARPTVNLAGRIERVDLYDSRGRILERYVFHYDAEGRCSGSDRYDNHLQPVDSESSVRNDDGNLLEHSLKRANGTYVYREKWIRDDNGKSLYAEYRKYDEQGSEIDYRKVLPKKERRNLRMKKKRPRDIAFCVAFLALLLVTGSIYLFAN